MVDGGHDGDQGEGDHDREERDVADALAHRDTDRQVAEHARDGDETHDRRHPAKCAAHQQQQRQRPDRIGRHPLGRQGQTQQQPDDGHGQPGRSPRPPPARPDRGEQGVGRDDEQAHVHVVHADPRLDEEQPVQEREGGHQSGHEASAEQDPGQDVQAQRHECPGDDPRQPPGEGVRPDLHGRHCPVRAEHEQLLSIVRGVLRLDVHHPGRRRHAHRESRICVHGVGVRFDHIDRPGIGRAPGGVRAPTQDVDLLRGVVIGDPRARARQRVAPHRDRTLRGSVAAGGDDGVLRDVWRTAGHVQLRIVDTQDQCQAVGATGQHDRARDLRRRRVDEDHSGVGRDGDPRQIHDREAGQTPVVDRIEDLGPGLAGARVAHHDLAVGADGPSERRRIRGRVAIQQLGQGRRRSRRVLHERRVGDDRGAGAGRSKVGDPGQRRGPQDPTIVRVHGTDPVGRGGHDRGAILADEEVRHRMVDPRERDRRCAWLRRTQADRREVDRRDGPIVETDDQLRTGRIHGQGSGARSRDDADEGARAQVVGADLLAGRDVDAFSGTPAQQLIVTPRLAGGGPDSDAQSARGADIVLAPQDEAGGQGVLGEVRVGPFVDVVRIAVAPGLEELRRRPRVVDLVEMHLVRLGKPERAHPQGRDEEERQDPYVQPVEPAPAFADQQSTAIRPERRLRDPVTQPADDPGLAEGSALGPGRQRNGGQDRNPRGRGRDGVGNDRPGGSEGGSGTRKAGHVGLADPADHAGPADHGTRDARTEGRLLRDIRGGPGRPPEWTSPTGVDAGPREVVRQPFATVAAELDQRPPEGRRVDDRGSRDADLRAQEPPDPQPVGDRRIVRIEGRQDDVHVGEGGHREGDVGHPPARGNREQDRPEREEGEAVALMDAGRDGEEGQRQQGEAHQHREPVGVAGHHPQDQGHRREQQPGAHDDRRYGAEQGDPRATLARDGRHRVAHPKAGTGQAVAEVARDEGPGVVRIDGQVRVPAAGDDDLVHQPGTDERRL